VRSLGGWTTDHRIDVEPGEGNRRRRDPAELRPADILLFQEVRGPRESDASVAEKSPEGLGFEVQFAAPDGGSTVSGSQS
jgi:hypothetical protein